MYVHVCTHAYIDMHAAYMCTNMPTCTYLRVMDRRTTLRAAAARQPRDSPAPLTKQTAGVAQNAGSAT